MRYLYLDSNKSNNNKFTLDDRISGEYKLTSFYFTNNVYNVNDNNNKIPFIENNISYTATLTNGYYDSSDFVSHLSTILNNEAIGTITITLDENTRKLTITDTLNIHFTFGSNTNNSGNKLMGFNETDGTANTTQVSENAIDLNSCKNIFINISENDDKNIIGTEYFDSSLIITGLGEFGEMVRYIDNDNFDQYIKMRNTKYLELNFHDSNNNEISLNSEYILILKKC